MEKKIVNEYLKELKPKYYSQKVVNVDCKNQRTKHPSNSNPIPILDLLFKWERERDRGKD